MRVISACEMTGRLFCCAKMAAARNVFAVANFAPVEHVDGGAAVPVHLSLASNYLHADAHFVAVARLLNLAHLSGRQTLQPSLTRVFGSCLIVANVAVVARILLANLAHLFSVGRLSKTAPPMDVPIL